MADINFYYNAVESATITASAGGSTLNLKDRNPNHKWTSGGTTNYQTLTFDLGSARTCDSCVVDGINWADTMGLGTQTIELYHSSDASTWTWVANFSNSNSKHSVSFSSISKRYWQIKFVESVGNLSTYPTLANFFIGTKITMTNHPYDISFEFGRNFATAKTRSYNGTLYTSQSFAGIKNWILKWSNISDSLRTNLLDLHNNVRGSYLPFYFSDADSSLYLVTMNDEFSVEKKAYNVNDAVELNLENFNIE